jgi:hypothetical protein
MPRARNTGTEDAGAAYHIIACGNQGQDAYGEGHARRLRHLLPPNQGVAGSRTVTSEPPEERAGERGDAMTPQALDRGA